MPSKATPLFLVYDGLSLEGLVFRAVGTCPPSIDHFRSYEALGMPYTPRQHFRATGVSGFTERSRLVMHIAKYGLPPAIATLDLNDPNVVWTRTGRSAHVTVWAPASLLLERVVQCEHG